MQRIEAARQLFLQEGFGVLSTISMDIPGYPFGSVTPYCADEQCAPIIYISHIAQHTKNIVADSRVSLTVLESQSGSQDVQAQGRVTCIGNARPVLEDETRVRERYFRYFPQTRQYEGTHDFAFFRLELVKIRFIGGFGQIYWVEPAEFRIANPFSASQESRIIDHMNGDHSEALRHYSGGTEARMVGIDSEGFDVVTSNGKRRFTFRQPVGNIEEARQALVLMAKS